MKLPNTTKDRVTLSAIEYYPRMSEETAAFNARVTIDGKTSDISNDGHGGCHMYAVHDVSAMVDAYARTLPDLPPDPSIGMTEPLAMCGDLLIAMMIEDAIKAPKAPPDGRLPYLKIGDHVSFVGPDRPNRTHAKLTSKGPKWYRVTAVDGKRWKVHPAGLQAEQGPIDVPTPAAEKRPEGIRRGGRVSWETRGGTRGAGVVTRINGKTVSVAGDDGRDWRVPFHLLKTEAAEAMG